MKPILSKERLAQLGEEGMLAAPSESEGQFIEQVKGLQEIDKNGADIFFDKPFEKWTCDFCQKLGADPKWVPVTYSNRGLFFWQGAALWVFETPMGHTIPMIQLREGFKKGAFLFSSVEEVLIHEAVHALRARFDEPQFEELLAYSHSPSRWRRFWGPFFRTQRHAFFSLFLIFFSFALQAFSLFFFPDLLLSYLKFVPLFPLTDLLVKGALLVRDQRLFNRVLFKLLQIFPRQKEGVAIAIRLKDCEIRKFGKDSIENILDYIKKETSKSVRWRQIMAQFS